MSASAAVERANADARDQRMRALRGELEQVAEELQETEKIHQEAQELGDESLLEEIQGDLARLQVVTPAEPGECSLPWQGMLLRNGALCRFTQNLCEEVLAPEVCALCCGS